MTSDLRILEGLIKQLSHELIAAAAPGGAEQASTAAAAFAEIEKIEPAGEELGEFEVETVELEDEETVPSSRSKRRRSSLFPRRRLRPRPSAPSQSNAPFHRGRVRGWRPRV